MVYAKFMERFDIQYIILKGCELPVAPEEVIRKAFNINPFENFSLRAQNTDFSIMESDISMKYCDIVAQKLWENRIYELADFTVVFLIKVSINHLSTTKNMHRNVLQEKA